MRADREFADWYRQEYPRVATTLALATRNDAAAEEATAEAFAKGPPRDNSRFTRRCCSSTRRASRGVVGEWRRNRGR